MKYFLFLLLVFNSTAANSQSLKDVNDSLLYYYQGQKFEQAIPFAEKAVVLIKEKYGVENTYYTKYLGLLSGMYLNNWQFLKAEQVLLEMNSIQKNEWRKQQGIH
jgi:hypothetical protein